MIPLAEVQGKDGISHPGGLRVKEDGSPQANQQTNQPKKSAPLQEKRNSCWRKMSNTHYTSLQSGAPRSIV